MLSIFSGSGGVTSTGRLDEERKSEDSKLSSHRHVLPTI
jgi:hypothetical protein